MFTASDNMRHDTGNQCTAHYARFQQLEHEIHTHPLARQRTRPCSSDTTGPCRQDSPQQPTSVTLYSTV